MAADRPTTEPRHPEHTPADGCYECERAAQGAAARAVVVRSGAAGYGDERDWFHTSRETALQRLPRFAVINGEITPHAKGTLIRLDDALGAAPRAEGLDEALTGEALYREYWRMQWLDPKNVQRQWEQLPATERTLWGGLAAFAMRSEVAAPRAEGHTVRYVDAGRDEPPENGFWRCSCGKSFAPDGVDEYASHLAAPRAEGLDFDVLDLAIRNAYDEYGTAGVIREYVRLSRPSDERDVEGE